MAARMSKRTRQIKWYKKRKEEESIFRQWFSNFLEKEGQGFLYRKIIHWSTGRSIWSYQKAWMFTLSCWVRGIRSPESSEDTLSALLLGLVSARFRLISCQWEYSEACALPVYIKFSWQTHPCLLRTGQPLASSALLYTSRDTKFQRLCVGLCHRVWAKR